MGIDKLILRILQLQQPSEQLGMLEIVVDFKTIPTRLVQLFRIVDVEAEEDGVEAKHSLLRTYAPSHQFVPNNVAGGTGARKSQRALL